MNKLLYFGIGVVLGAGIGILCSKKHYEQLAYTEINDIRNAYKKKAAAREKVEKNSEMKEELYQKASEAQERYSGGESETPQPLRVPVKKIERKERKYNIFSENPYDPELDEEEETDDPYEILVDHTGPSDDGYSEPRIITEEEWASEKLFYDKVIIEYYTDGVAVLEDSDQIVDSIGDLIGPDVSLPKWNEEMVYIRNDGRSSDYGIIFMGRDFVQEEAPD